MPGFALGVLLYAWFPIELGLPHRKAHTVENVTDAISINHNWVNAGSLRFMWSVKAWPALPVVPRAGSGRVVRVRACARAHVRGCMRAHACVHVCVEMLSIR